MQALKVGNYIYMSVYVLTVANAKCNVQSLLETSNYVLRFSGERAFELNVLRRYMYTLCTYFIPIFVPT